MTPPSQQSMPVQGSVSLLWLSDHYRLYSIHERPGADDLRSRGLFKHTTRSGGLFNHTTRSDQGAYLNTLQDQGAYLTILQDQIRGPIRSEERRVGKECRSRWS